jgi:hypothetical protein
MLPRPFSITPVPGVPTVAEIPTGTVPAGTTPAPPPAAARTTPPAAARRNDVPAFAFLVEIAGAKNERVLCPIDSHICRGRWARKNLVGKQIDGDFNAMPDLPGICFVVNTAKRVVRRFDPLADPDNAKVLKRAQRVALATLGVKYAPEKAKTWKERTLDDNTMKTFVFWILRLVDAGLVNVVKGRVPEFAEIRKLPGVIQLQMFSQMAGTDRGVPDDKIRYVKPVPPDDDEGDERFDDEVPDPVINAGRGDGLGDDGAGEDDDE